MKMLLVRSHKVVHDAAGQVLGQGGALLPLDAPIRESDRTKVVLFETDEPEVIAPVTHESEDLE